MVPTTSTWLIRPEDLEAALATPPIPRTLLDQMVEAELKYLDGGIRRALGLWVSELEPELMFRQGETRPFGITAVGHRTPYIELKWDESFHTIAERRP